MTKDEMILLAKEAGWEYADDDRGFEPLWAFYHLAVAAEQNRCIGIIYGQCGSDNVAQRTVDAIRSQS